MKWPTSHSPGEFTLFTTSCRLRDGAKTSLEKTWAGLVDTALEAEQNPRRESGKRAEPLTSNSPSCAGKQTSAYTVPRGGGYQNPKLKF